MNKKMTSKERILAAVRSQKVDYVPMNISFYVPGYNGSGNEHSHSNITWGTNERKRLETYRDWGWDTTMDVNIMLSLHKSVKTSINYEVENGIEILHQNWQTPAGTINEKIKMTDDWPTAKGRTTNYPFSDDFRTARYIEFPFKNAKDLDTLEYLFPIDNPEDMEAILQQYKEKKALADEFQVPLIAGLSTGMDWLMWLYPPEEAIIRVIDEPETINRLLSHINKAMMKRLEMLLQLGVDCVMRRGYYESADFWSPDIFRKYAKPVIEKEVQIVHAANTPYVYNMYTGIMPMLDDLAEIPFDCLYGADPAYGHQDLRTIHSKLPGKALWGGISGVENFANGTPEQMEEAVRNAFDIFGKTGYILSPTAGIRHYCPWENVKAFEREWKRLR